MQYKYNPFAIRYVSRDKFKFLTNIRHMRVLETKSSND